MPQDPVEEWRRLSALYSEMGDVEIEDLADQLNDLTPTAQQALRDELKKRGISDNPDAPRIPVPFPNDYTAEDLDLESKEEDRLQNYTWKVALCRCESLDEAAARSEMLRRARIDSWIQRPGARFDVPWLEVGTGAIQINVAADQLDHARTIITQPIPQDIIDQLNEEAGAPQYELPTCPKCGAPDPILESVEPSNNWLCESCDNNWSDPIPEISSQ